MFVGNKEIVVNGQFVRKARLRAEFYEWIDDPHSFIAKLKESEVKADLFIFLQSIDIRKPLYDFHQEWENISVIPLKNYNHWWNKQIKDKTRNMVRKASKKGVEIRLVEFNDNLVWGIKDIYDESPMRQGNPFKHYNKDFEVLKKAHISFLDRSQFVGAFYEEELIGFIKLVHDKKISHLMQIISKIKHRDKAPTNALIAKAVEICTEKNIPFLHYGLWSRRGLGDFKINHGFQKFGLPRYVVPLNSRGKFFLKLGIYKLYKEYLSGNMIDFLVNMRTKWNNYKYPKNKT